MVQLLFKQANFTSGFKMTAQKGVMGPSWAVMSFTEVILVPGWFKLHFHNL